MGCAKVTAVLISLSGGWFSVVMRDGSWLFSSAWGSAWSIERSVGSTADGSGAVSSIKTVCSSADWEWSGALDNNWDPLFIKLNLLLVLVVVVFITLHDNILSEILISVHSGGEKHVIAENSRLS